MFYVLAFCLILLLFFFFFNDTATTEIYTLSLHDALPILHDPAQALPGFGPNGYDVPAVTNGDESIGKDPVVVARLEQARSEEHTSELQSLAYLVCRLLLEKKNVIRDGRVVGHRPLNTVGK